MLKDGETMLQVTYTVTAWLNPREGDIKCKDERFIAVYREHDDFSEQFG